jgi:Domain of unknown function (DUF4157)
MTFSCDQKAHAEPAAIAAPHQQRLPSGLREESTAHFGAHFDDIDISPTAVAPAMTANGAAALTVGDDIAFGDTAYPPESGWGRELIAHELAHVAQRRGSTGLPSDALAHLGGRPGPGYSVGRPPAVQRVLDDRSPGRPLEPTLREGLQSDFDGASIAQRTEGVAMYAPKIPLLRTNSGDSPTVDRGSRHDTRNTRPYDDGMPRWAFAGSAAIHVGSVLSTPGEPLDSSVRALMEPRFSFDFSHVRVHSGPGPAATAVALGAAAYTVGSSIVFGQDKYAPQTREGQHLLAHELSHVVQAHRATPVSLGGLRIAPPSSVPELDAHRVAEALAPSVGMRGTLSAELSPAPLSLYRTPAVDSQSASTATKQIVYIDASVIIWIERGNAQAAEVLKGLLESSEVRIPESVYDELTSKAEWKETATAHKILVEDLRINVWGAPNVHVADLMARNTVHSKKGVIYSADRGDVPALAAVTRDATYLTLDRRLYNNRADITGRLGVKFHPASFDPNPTSTKAGDPDYSRGRALLGLDPIVIDPVSGKLERRGRQASIKLSGSSTFSQHPSGKIVSGELVNSDPLPAEPDPRGPGKPPDGGAGGAGGSPTGASRPNTAKPAGHVPLEGSPPVTARDFAREISQTETTNRRMASAAKFARYALEAENFLGVLEQIAGGLNLAAATLAGGPLQKEKQQAIAALASATELANYYDNLDLRKNIPPGGWAGWEGWADLQQIQFDYYEIESQMGLALESVDAALQNIGSQIGELADAVTEKTAALVLTPVSTPYADAYLFADAAGQLRSHLLDAAQAYGRARHGIYFSRQMVRASIKFMEIRLRQLGVSGLVSIDVDDDDLKKASLYRFTMRP